MSKKTEKISEPAEKKKTEPRGKKSAVKPEAKSKEKAEAPSSKTPQVMKLVEPHGDVVNPVIIAGKSSIPKQLRGVAPLSKILRKEALGLGIDISDDEMVTVNLTEIVIKENAEELLRRFNACDCDRCVAALCEITAQQVAACFVKTTKSALAAGLREFAEQKEQQKKIVISQMIRQLMGNKKRSFH